MVHILNSKPQDMNLLGMLYNLLSKEDPILYLVSDTIYRVPHWEEIVEKAKYWFSEVHLVAGQPWLLVIERCDIFDSVNIVLTQTSKSIFTRCYNEMQIKPSQLTTRTTIIGGSRNPKYYKNYVGVDEVNKELPFPVSSILIDDDLKVYNNIKSRLGDLA